jgi:hypothetical protein
MVMQRSTVYRPRGKLHSLVVSSSPFREQPHRNPHRHFVVQGNHTRSLSPTIICCINTNTRSTRISVSINWLNLLLVLQLILGFSVHSHAAAALINFCEGVERDTLVPYLDPIVERLLKMLNPGAENDKAVKSYVQEQAITTLAMVADASETTFVKVLYSLMRPSLI